MVDLCKHGIPHADCGHCIEPHIRVIAVALPMLIDLQETLIGAGIWAEASIADGLLQLLAELVKSSSPPQSEEYAAAEAVLNPAERE